MCHYHIITHATSVYIDVRQSRSNTVRLRSLNLLIQSCILLLGLQFSIDIHLYHACLAVVDFHLGKPKITRPLPLGSFIVVDFTSGDTFLLTSASTSHTLSICLPLHFLWTEYTTPLCQPPPLSDFTGMLTEDNMKKVLNIRLELLNLT